MLRLQVTPDSTHDWRAVRTRFERWRSRRSFQCRCGRAPVLYFKTASATPPPLLLILRVGGGDRRKKPAVRCHFDCPYDDTVFHLSFGAVTSRSWSPPTRISPAAERHVGVAVGTGAL
jgi:hypothetical protein